MGCSVLLYPQTKKKDVNTSKERSKCFDSNPKQKNHYDKWKRFIKNLADKPNEIELKKR